MNFFALCISREACGEQTESQDYPIGISLLTKQQIFEVDLTGIYCTLYSVHTPKYLLQNGRLNITNYALWETDLSSYLLRLFLHSPSGYHPNFSAAHRRIINPKLYINLLLARRGGGTFGPCCSRGLCSLETLHPETTNRHNASTSANKRRGNLAGQPAQGRRARQRRQTVRVQH